MTEINTTIQLYRAAFCSTFTFSIVKYIRYNVDYHYSTVFVRAGFIIVNSRYKINTFTLMPILSFLQLSNPGKANAFGRFFINKFNKVH